jgi:hypothetical protein
LYSPIRTVQCGAMNCELLFVGLPPPLLVGYEWKARR